MQRFSPNPDTCDQPMVQNPYGDWVRFSDHDAEMRRMSTYLEHARQDNLALRDANQRLDDEVAGLRFNAERVGGGD